MLRLLEEFEAIVDEKVPSGILISEEAKAQGRLPASEINEILNNSKWSPELESDEIEDSSLSQIRNVSDLHSSQLRILY